MSIKTIVMTGGSSGIGAATSKLFLDDGNKVISLDVKEHSERLPLISHVIWPSLILLPKL